MSQSATATMIASDVTMDGGEAPVRGAPQLVLAVGADGLRGPERVDMTGRQLVLGRGCEVFPSGPLDDARMSREHFTLHLRRGTWLARDDGSRNGTRINGESLQGERPVQFGDVIRAGDSHFVIAAPPPSGAGDPDPELIGQSFAALELVRVISQVAPHPTSVLLTGETGTGKEVSARTLHRLSGRNGKFVAVNCGAFAEGVLESELFGHRKGAFTGAVEANRGLFRAADGGTLFLDEVGEMPAALQVKLLRVLESHQVRPVGETRDIAVDVRVVAATNRDLVAEVRSQRFRADLYARLSQWPIHLPPLRSRREDVPLLVQHVLAGHGEAPRALSASLAEALLRHDWPLNVRGLVNCIGIARIASRPGGPLELGPEVRAALDAGSAIAAPRVESLPTPDPRGLNATLPSAPAILPPDEQIEEALREQKGRIAAAARTLGLSRQQMYRWMERAGRTADDYRD